MYSLGIDIGSSSIKASLLNLSDNAVIASDFYPKQEMEIVAHKAGWAEQHPDTWWNNIKILLKELFASSKVDTKEIKFIGISYQMHGLVAVDKEGNVLRPSIIWCDSRAVEIGKKASIDLGQERIESLLNSPGNFTASKLKWVQENEPELYAKIYKIMLPGDYIAYKLTGEFVTTKSGLSEGIFWDFKKEEVSEDLLSYYQIDKNLIPEIVDTFSNQGKISVEIAKELQLGEDVMVSYRAGDQPNNALSLNVFKSGEVAATAGTSGVVYGISDELKFDKKSRVNTFAHVNHLSDGQDQRRLGVLLNINGTGIMNAWIRKNTAANLSYEEMNEVASKVASGSDGLMVFPYGNGAERIFENSEPGASVHNLNFNIHTQGHLIRATQESIAFSFKYGMEIMEKVGINTSVIRAGLSNMFLSPIFAETLSNISGAKIELYDTDGSQGAARAAGFGGGYFESLDNAFGEMEKLKTIEPKKDERLEEAYNNWKNKLETIIG
ncbi:MAG: FGGY family carbohydrate kinase [Bacteroidota bacterium]